mmetsp:Transcript_45614/g.74060  ORF Transcript_45614/g.74060 Transcript_45614/m.74060 type:complete len:357 (-) Transcript_45614:153-1223(-)
MDTLLVLLWRLACHDDGHLPVLGVGESAQQGAPLELHEVGLDLHDNVVARHQRGDCVQELSRGQFIQGLDAKGQERLVVAVLERSCLGLDEATVHRPVDDLSVAQLHIVGVLLQEAIQPIEGALVRQAYRKDHFELLVLVWCRHSDCVGLRCILDHAALEGKRGHGLRTEVHLHRDVSEGDVREERLTLQLLWQRLRLRHAPAILEETDGVAICTGWVQVQKHSHDVVPDERLGHRGLDLVGVKEAIRVKAHRVRGLAQEQGGALLGEADPALLLGHHVDLQVADSPHQRGVQHLDDADLEHIAPLLDSHVGPSASDKVLKPGVGERHQNFAAAGRDHVQSGVADVDVDGLALHFP